MREPAVIVAGGGPAGSAVARLLSLWGHSVLLLTRPSTRPPFAESLPPSCRKLLDPLGVIPRIDAAGFVRTTGNTVWWGGTEARRHNFGGDEPGYQVRRDVLDQLLLEAAEAAGVEVRRNAAVREIRPPDSPMEPPRPDTQLESGGGPQAGPAEMTLAQAAMTVTGQAGEPARPVGTPAVRFDSDGQSHTLHAPWIVDATGQTGVLARRSWRRAGHAPRTLALVAAWDRHDSWDLDDATHTLVESYESGWAWS